MTDYDIKQIFNEAVQRVGNSNQDSYEELTREIVSIERKTYYGAEPDHRRLARIRELIQMHVKNEAEKNENYKACTK